MKIWLPYKRTSGSARKIRCQ